MEVRMSDFEEFKFRRIRTPDKPFITITKSGIIYFNSETMQRYIREKSYALLYYSGSDNKIGIKFTDNETANTYKIRKSRRDKLGSISGIAFLKYYRIDFKTTKPFDVNWNEKEEMLIIDLKQNEEKEKK